LFINTIIGEKKLDVLREILKFENGNGKLWF